MKPGTVFLGAFLKRTGAVRRGRLVVAFAYPLHTDWERCYSRHCVVDMLLPVLVVGRLDSLCERSKWFSD